MLNMTMRSRAKKKRTHLVHLNDPVLKKEEENLSDTAK